jgi:hypothetical protein
MLIAFGYACKHSDRCRQLQVNGKSDVPRNGFPISLVMFLSISLVTRRISPARLYALGIRLSFAWERWQQRATEPKGEEISHQHQQFSQTAGVDTPVSPSVFLFFHVFPCFSRIFDTHDHPWTHGEISFCLGQVRLRGRLRACCLRMQRSCLRQTVPELWIVVAWEWLFHVFPKVFCPYY